MPTVDVILPAYNAARYLPAALESVAAQSFEDWQTVLYADEAWLPCRLEESVRALRDRPRAGLAYGLVTSIDSEGDPGGTFAGNRSHAEGRIAAQIDRRKVDLPCPANRFRRRCTEEVGSAMKAVALYPFDLVNVRTAGSTFLAWIMPR